MDIEITTDNCTGYGRCVADCPGKALAIADEGPRRHAIIVSKGLCLGCKRCMRLCPNQAITVRRNHAKPQRPGISRTGLRLLVGSLLVGSLITAVRFLVS